MKTTTLLTTVLLSLMVLTTACGKATVKSESPVGNAAACTNCTGFQTGPTVFSGAVASGAFRIDGLQVVADQNSLATVESEAPQISGTYQGMVTGGTLTAAGSSCLPDGSYQVQGLQVGSISPSLSVQAVNPMWVTLSGPSTIQAPLYITLADSNGDGLADAGSTVYLWLYCNGAWTSLSMSAN